MLAGHEHRRPERKGKGSTADLRIVSEEGYLDRTWSMDGDANQEQAGRAFRGPAGFDAEMGAVQSWKSMLAVSAAGGLTVLRVRDRRIVCQVGLRFILHRPGDWRERPRPL